MSEGIALLSTQQAAARQIQSNRINEALKRRAWSQADLARSTGLPRYTISRLVRGENLASEEVGAKLARALDLEPGAFSEHSKGAARSAIAEGFISNALPDGRERVQMAVTVDLGTRMALEAIARHQEPITLKRLSAILIALTQPLADT